MSVVAPPSWLAAWPPVGDFVARVRRIDADAFATSWWRGIADNARVGGHPYSQHLLGLAADFVPGRTPAGRIVALARAQGLVAIDEGDHVHLQLLRAGLADDVIDYVRHWL